METRPPEIMEIEFLTVYDICLAIHILFQDVQSPSLFPVRAIHESLLKGPCSTEIVFCLAYSFHSSSRPSLPFLN